MGISLAFLSPLFPSVVIYATFRSSHPSPEVGLLAEVDDDITTLSSPGLLGRQRPSLLFKEDQIELKLSQLSP